MMDRGEPSLVPEWYKSANGGAGLSPISDSVNSSRSRALAFGDRGSLSSNGFGVRDNDSHPYSSFGRNRDRDRELRGRDRVRDRRSQVDDRVYESLNANSRDRSRRSHSLEHGRKIESQTKNVGNGLRNGVVSGLGAIGGNSRASFERDFPSLGSGVSERVSSPGIGAFPCSPMDVLPVLRTGGWTSALVDVPAPQTPTPSATTGLKMAEALVQAPSRVRTPPELSVDIQKAEELSLRQSKLLIPVMPSMPKTSALNSSERMKLSKGTRGDLSIFPKVGHQASYQLVNHALHTPLRSNTIKTFHAGNLQVLHREDSVSSHTGKEMSATVRGIHPPGASALDAVPPVKSTLSPKPNVDRKGNAISSSPHRPVSQAQKRNDFFNTLRKKSPMNHLTANSELNYNASSSSLDKSREQGSGTCMSANPENHALATDTIFNYFVENENGVTNGCDPCERLEWISSGKGENKSSAGLITELDKEKQPGVERDNQALGTDSGLTCPFENGYGVTEKCDPCERPEISSTEDNLGLVINLDKEEQLLKLFGWNEDANEEALTVEEIETYYRKHGNIKPTLKYSHHAGGGSCGLSSSGCKA